MPPLRFGDEGRGGGRDTLTAEAGAEVLREGGNAVDACIAAACMSWVTESTLTSPGGGGFLLVRQSSTGRVRLHDFFIAIPGQGLARPPGRWRRSTSSSIAARRRSSESVVPRSAFPGRLPGSRRRTAPTRPFLATPAGARDRCRARGPRADEATGLPACDPRRDPSAHRDRPRDLGPEGVRLVAGDRLVMPDLAATLELLADEGAAASTAASSAVASVTTFEPKVAASHRRISPSTG